MGGPHVTFLPDEAMEHSNFIIRGEGEVPFLAFMDAFEGGGGWESVPNLSYRQGCDIVHNQGLVAAPRLSNLPFPDLSLIRSFGRSFFRTPIPIETSRGCPFKCEFCSVSRFFGRRMRFRPIAETVEELKKHSGMRKFIFFVDDNFAANPERTKRLLQAILEADIRISWAAQMRSDASRDKELLELMKRSGCEAVCIGIETINPQTLCQMKKQQDVSEVMVAIKDFHRFGIRVHGMFILGFDEDGKSVGSDTVRFASRVRLNTSQFLILTPLPGSQIFDSLIRDQRIITKDWSLYDGHHIVYKPLSILPYDLQRLQMKAHRKFYSLYKQLKRLFKIEFSELGVAHYASRINRKWKRDNRGFMRWLKHMSGRIRSDSKPNPDIS
jgi:radical SAM superfamily enzyme YgiQ (UPF0313 family)